MTDIDTKTVRRGFLGVLGAGAAGGLLTVARDADAAVPLASTIAVFTSTNDAANSDCSGFDCVITLRDPTTSAGAGGALFYNDTPQTSPPHPTFNLGFYDSVGNWFTRQRHTSLSSERCETEPGAFSSAMIATSRSRVGSNAVRSSAISSLWVHTRGLYHASTITSRQVEVSGEASLIASSRGCRVFGQGGTSVSDPQDYWGQSLPMHPSAYRDSETAGQLFYHCITASAGCDIVAGSNNYIAASRGNFSTNPGGTSNTITVDEPTRVGGTCNAAVGSNQITIDGEENSIVSSRLSDISSGAKNTTLLAAADCNISGEVDRSAIVAASDSSIGGGCEDTLIGGAAHSSANLDVRHSAIIGSRHCDLFPEPASGFLVNAVIAAGHASANVARRSMVVSSTRVKNEEEYVLCGGYSGSGSAVSGNKKWELDSKTGDLRLAGSVQPNHSFADFAEAYENLEKGAIPVGTVVTEVEGKCCPARNANDYILGVVTRTAAVVGGAASLHWKGRYQMTDFGEILKEPVPCVRWYEDSQLIYEGPKSECTQPIPANAEHYVEDLPLLNPDYDPQREYLPRLDRPQEYSVVGVLGRVFVRVDHTARLGTYLNAQGGRSELPTRIRCERITKPYSSATGYGVALALIR